MPYSTIQTVLWLNEYRQIRQIRLDMIRSSIIPVTYFIA